jgi:hypothetical protein
VTSDLPLNWPDTALAEYGETMTVHEVASSLVSTPKAIRALINHPARSHRLPASKVGRGWVVGRTDLRAYLLEHRNVRSNR